MKKNCLRVGLTGGFGCGKSTVRHFLHEQGVATIDADTLARDIAATDAIAVARIKEAFGDDVYSADGELQRQLLARRAFVSPERIGQLNRIIHPRVRALVDEQVAGYQTQGHRFVVIEAALFYETGWYKKMDYMAVVTAPEDKRRTWLEKKRGFSQEEIDRRLQHQLPLQEKEAKADFLIRNEGDLDELRRETRKFLEWLQLKAAG